MELVQDRIQWRALISATLKIRVMLQESWLFAEPVFFNTLNAKIFCLGTEM